MAKYTFTKEKNLYCFMNNETKAVEKFDVNIGKWLGKKRQPIKTVKVPYCYQLECIDYPLLLKNYNQEISTINLELLSLIDRLISLGYGNNIRLWTASLAVIVFCNEHFSQFVEYIKEHIQEDNYISPQDFYNMTVYESIYNERINPVVMNKEYFIDIVSSHPLYAKYIDVFCHYCNKNYKGNVFSIWNLREYFNLCELLSVEPKKGDFCKNYTEILIEYNRTKDEIDNKIVSQVQNYISFKEYSNPNFILEIPQTINDFQRLGEEFNNCLGLWELNNRIFTKKYCVVILRGDTWKVSTDICLENYQIDQKYFSHNRRIADPTILGYIDDLQDYLDTIKYQING